jgi:hypothetical protein
VDYLAVRDLAAARFVRDRVPATSPLVVPDTVFGISAVLDDGVRRAARDALVAAGVAGGYVVVQPSQLLEGHARAIDDVAAAARDQGLDVVELPIGPCHLDEVGRLGLTGTTCSLQGWPDPAVAAAVLAGAEAVVAASLHAGVVATACGVPVYRPRAASDSKHELLDALPGVVTLPAEGEDAELPIRFGRTAPSSQVTSAAAVLSHHWDEVAARATGRGARGIPSAVAELVSSLPELLDLRRLEALALVEREREGFEEVRRRDADALGAMAGRLAALQVRVEAQDEVAARTSVRWALRLADRWGRLRRTSHGDGAPQ